MFICLCLCVCVYIYIYIYTYTHTYIYLYIQLLYCNPCVIKQTTTCLTLINNYSYDFFMHNQYLWLVSLGLCSNQFLKSPLEKEDLSENNWAICFLLEIPLRGFPFQMNLHDKCRIPNKNIHLIVQWILFEKESPHENLQQETYHTHPVLTPSPPTKSLGFGGFDSSKLLILRVGNSHVRLIS